jgi:hypothetical protein
VLDKIREICYNNNNMDKDITELLEEIRIVHYAERAYHYAYPREINHDHKKRVMEKLVNYIKSDKKFPKFFDLVGYAKCIR